MQAQRWRMRAWLALVIALALVLVVWRRSAAPLTRIRTVVRPVRRLQDVRGYLARRAAAPPHAVVDLARLETWEDVPQTWPDVSDRHTLRMLARFACWAYYETVPARLPDAPGWAWSSKFGWDEGGLRGQVFATANNATVVVALKGTSASILPGGSTAQRDKDNDNLLFSCCCARVDSSWKPMCDCWHDPNTCDSRCMGRTLIERSLYYPAATDLYNNISYLYPNSQVWVTGHSLGGVMASFLGATFGVPAIAFESPGDRVSAARLHLPIPPPSTPDDDAYALVPVTHVYHTADALATGQCVGRNSICSRTGFAMETRCHIGQSVVYDTVRYLGWSVGVLPHRITVLISDLLAHDWEPRIRAARLGPPPLPAASAVPAPQRETLCQGTRRLLTQTVPHGHLRSYLVLERRVVRLLGQELLELARRRHLDLGEPAWREQRARTVVHGALVHKGHLVVETLVDLADHTAHRRVNVRSGFDLG